MTQRARQVVNRKCPVSAVDNTVLVDTEHSAGSVRQAEIRNQKSEMRSGPGVYRQR